MKIMVSACLTGLNCKYDGGNNRNEQVLKLQEKHKLIPVCPEVLGGLSVPRVPSEIKDGVVTAADGKNVDNHFREGARKCLEIALKEQPDLIVFQSRSPSCGVKQRYDGTFTGTLVDAPGVTAQLLMEHGFRVIDVEDLDSALLVGEKGVTTPEKRRGGFEVQEKRKGPGTAAFVIMLIIAVLAIAAVVYLGLDKYRSIQEARAKEEAAAQVTVVMVEHKLEEIAELSTYTYMYSGYDEIKDAAQLFGWDVPLTTHEIKITYDGIIKAGYDFSKIGIRVDDKLKQIHIALPSELVVDNIINEENVRCESKNNVFNPINADEVTKYLSGVKEEALKKAKEEGLYEKAEENVKQVISVFLGAFEDYEVVFD